MRRLVGPILLLFAIRAFSQTAAPGTHTYNSNVFIDTIWSKQGLGPGSRLGVESGSKLGLQPAAKPGSNLGLGPGLKLGLEPERPSGMRAQLLSGAGARATRTVILSSITLNITTTPSTCDGNNGTIVVSPSGGTAPYQFQLDGGSWTYSSIFFTNSTAPHTVTVKDAAGQSVSATVTLTNNYDMPSLALGSYVYPSGCMAMDGSVTLLASGGQPPYSYSFDGQTWQSSPTFSGLALGWYYLTVKDANGCTNSAILLTPTSDCAAFHLTMTPTCGNDGKFVGTMDPTTPNPPYSYSLNGTGPFQRTLDFTGLTPGPYIIHIKDGSGNIVYYLEFTIPRICRLALKAVTADAACSGGGSITTTGLNGTPPYLYSIDGINYQSGNVFSGLAPGNYTVVVKDAAFTLQGLSVTINDNCVRGTANATPAYCSNSDGSITATATGGTPPYSYTVSGGGYNVTNATGSFTGLAAGTYTVTFMDSKNISASGALTVGTIPCLTANTTPSPAICEASNGQINAAGAGGTAPYSYSVSKAGVNWPFQASPVFPGLAAGNYTVTVKDVNGHTASTAVAITRLTTPALQVGVATTAASCRNDDGAIQLTGNGGTTPYQFSIDGVSYVSNGNYGQVPSGTYFVSVRDANGCTAVQPAVVALNNNLLVSAGPDPTICEGKSVILPASSNGRTFSWQPTAGLSDPSQLQPSATPRVTTSYTITATDGACQQKAAVNVIVNPAPTPEPGKDFSICYGASGQLHAAGGNVYAWTPATYLSDPTVADPLVEQPEHSMTYLLSTVDANGCSSLDPMPVTVTVTPPPQLSAGADTSITAGVPLGLNAVDINGTGFTSFTWSPAEGLSNPDVQAPIAVLSTGVQTYTVRAVSDAGCAATASITIKVFGVADIFVPTGFTPNGDGHNDVLRALPVGIREFKYFAVFSRWGQRVFFSSEASVGWTGLVNGDVQPIGTYVWMAAGIDYSGKLVERKGVVTLVR